MKTLLVMRHAKSSWNHPGLDDFERPLNERGERDAPRMGQWLRENGLTPNRILASPAIRAWTTAERVAQHARYAEDIDVHPEFYPGNPQDYVEAVRELGADDHVVLVIGHNPGVEDLVSLLTGRSNDMPTAAIAHITFPFNGWSDLAKEPCGELVVVARPKEL